MNQTGECSFCNPGKMKNQPIGGVWWKSWYIKHNDFPYPHQKLHLVIIHKTRQGEAHKTKLSELTPDEFAELLEVIKWVECEFKLPGGLFAFRFGAFDHSGATIAHLHCHIQVPDQTGPVVATAYLPDKLRDLLKAKKSIYQDWQAN